MTLPNLHPHCRCVSSSSTVSAGFCVRSPEKGFHFDEDGVLQECVVLERLEPVGFMVREVEMGVLLLVEREELFLVEGESDDRR